ncbi:hypothetical protein ABT299_44840 [Spirillospora sp. NPDC000708]
MTLRFSTHPIVSTARRLARQWCEGHQIDGAPAMAHGVKVAVCVGRHVPYANPELIAAAIIHDAPEFAPAAGVTDVYDVLTAELSAEVARIVQALAVEHQALDGGEAEPPIADLRTLLVSTADKAVSMASILNRGETAEDQVAYWQDRSKFLAAVPYIRNYYSRAAGVIPRPLADALRVMVIRAELAAARYSSAL